MRLGTLRLAGSAAPRDTVAVRIDDDAAVEITGFTDIGALLRAPGWEDAARGASGPSHSLGELEPTDWAPVVPRPGKIVCVGLNYANHIREMGRELPEFPTLFAKYPEALIGPYDAIELPPEAADAVDWEGELAIVIGASARRTPAAEAAEAIAGYAVINDVTMRDFQYRTPEWFQGKTFEGTTPFGPHLVTRDEFSPGPELLTDVDGELVQHTPTDDLVFGPEALVEYISSIFTLNPGDVIASGTPGGVGHARKPPRYLRDGSVLTTTIDGIGTLTNPVRKA
ncbi:fumarylacetoacetate hydrolase family protein [Microbacterium sp. STN6]|uniref:fumarylacetoacetate hydrolase family protein n=1 Tax=Microbacterium sp. STN6 TaxID=2995588 RepID=UPI00226086A8|nr:fumarylacetoacetate hydrolase family protein [Microbacterium sp. STN6]MCX7523306.1 fumarylacetoacetate hydrolase family protein [Microbacterium sp. STN6]